MTQSRALIALAAALALPLAGCGKDKTIDSELSATLTQPVAQVELKVQKEEPGKRTGEEIVAKVCSGCHGSGALGSPKTGDTNAWAPRIAQGYDALIASATNGKGNMPPKGGAADLTDKELARAVAYLANKGGADFKAPPVE
ncbi:cytochrome c5 family protein [Nitrogeniibacter mangrovi]|uniref:Cytochrome c5 family protein n=1 Tax=Nitrogeniibacter mangrovi TaxID=2016596 RepID=A0A6C1B0N9_9RHOO|nr:c-type cytochrome [Nitrogeniibacter mangrovi]QID16388.1 cytochrome c5 family protein [Nitrogeniibacter mangrovi]